MKCSFCDREIGSIFNGIQTEKANICKKCVEEFYETFNFEKKIRIAIASEERRLANNGRGAHI